MTSQIPNLPPPIYSQYSSPLPARPVWPIAIGVISTVWASLAVLGGIVAVFTSGAKARFGRGPNLYDYAADWYALFLTVIAVAGAAIAVCLLIGGISLLKRRPFARTFHLMYGILTIVISAVSLAGQITALDFAAMPTALRIGTIVGFASMLLGIAYPVFLIIWFSRRKIMNDLDAMRTEYQP